MVLQELEAGKIRCQQLSFCHYLLLPILEYGPPCTSYVDHDYPVAPSVLFVTGLPRQTSFSLQAAFFSSYECEILGMYDMLDN